ncbi:GHKL domain-containing protein [Paraclostridium bifermentans]|uniref:GHKL domain-containing protein n=1 Tax=Paraclostridium bifermentans TaxID=1490 RepID=UPI00359C4DA4
MLNVMHEVVLILSILIPFTVLKGILTYKKEGQENDKVVFYTLLLSTYIIVKISSLFSTSRGYCANTTYLIDIIIFIVFGLYYKYFYKIGYIKYGIVFFLFRVYYDLLYEVLNRILFIIITGVSPSSEEALLVHKLISKFEIVKIDIYTYIIILIIYALVLYINKRLHIFNNEKRNYIYLSLALMINIVNIIGRYTMGNYVISNNIILSKILIEWRNSIPILQDEWHYFDQLVIPKLVVASCIVIILLFRRVIKENKLKAQEELMQNKLDMQYSHYISIQESHMKVRQLYHDINNHIYCIDNLKNNSKEVNEYVNNLKDEIKEFKSIHNTGNMILDIIINEKSELCTKKGIKFTCDINFSKIDFMKPIDLCSIFTNILDNAIEACDKINDEYINKYIRIKGTIAKSFFIIKCENSKVNDIEIRKNRFLTDKKDKFTHGIGIKSIKSSLEKYNGELLFEDDKNKFVLNIYIPLNQNTDSWVD